MQHAAGKRPLIRLSDRELAIQIRMKWMKAMGLSDDDIAVHCADDVEINLKEEMENLAAIDEIRSLSIGA